MRKLTFVLMFLVCSESAWAERIKDLASLAGVRDNQLVGYGLVVGLDGSGDQTSQTPFTVQSLKNMLQQFEERGKAPEQKVEGYQGKALQDNSTRWTLTGSETVHPNKNKKGV